MADVKHVYDITPDDVNNLPEPITKLMVTVAGDVAIVLAADQDADVVIIAMTVGQILEGFRIKKVLATGTTATGLKGFN